MTRTRTKRKADVVDEVGVPLIVEEEDEETGITMKAQVGVPVVDTRMAEGMIMILKLNVVRLIVLCKSRG